MIKKQEEQLTHIWKQYQRGKEYLENKELYTIADINHKFYIGEQWDENAKKLKQPLPVMNIIKPICDYKIGVVAQNNMIINYSSENFSNQEMEKDEIGISFKEIADKTMELLNKYARKAWENNNMEAEMWNIVKEACIGGTSIAYFYYKDNKEVMEIVDNNNIYFSDENDKDIQSQDYILITFRRPVEQIKQEAKKNGLDTAIIQQIKADKDIDEQIGNKIEVETEDGKALCILKLYKKNGTVHMMKSTKNVIYVEETNLNLTYYPLAKLCWIDEKGSSRGRGEPQSLINNQKEINKTLARRLLAVTMTAYPKLAYLKNAISNPNSLDKVGVAIGIEGNSVQNISSVIDYLRPVQISPDAKQINDELQTNTKELAGAGDVALGTVNPEAVSGRAIIAVRDASTIPLNSQVSKYHKFVEDIARIWFDLWQNAVTEEKQVIIEQKNEETGKIDTIAQSIPKELLQRLKVNIRIDISNANPYSKYAQEQTIENLFNARAISFEEYVELLDNDSVTPKSKLEEIIRKRREKEEQIAQIEQEIKQKQLIASQVFKNQEITGGDTNEMQSM